MCTHMEVADAAMSSGSQNPYYHVLNVFDARGTEFQTPEPSASASA